jgi:hypothetical protein
MGILSDWARFHNKGTRGPFIQSPPASAEGTDAHTVKALLCKVGELVGRGWVKRIDAAHTAKPGSIILQRIEAVAIVPFVTDVLSDHRSLDAIGFHQFQGHRRSAILFGRVRGAWRPWISRAIDPYVNLGVDDIVF